MKLPVVSGSEAVKAFCKAGYEFDVQHGSHIVLRRADPPHRLYPQDWRSEIDVPRLIVQCLIVPLLAGAALWTA